MIHPDLQREIAACVGMLREGGGVIFPSETGWNLACDALNRTMVNEITSLEHTRYPALLLREAGMLNRYVAELSEVVYDLVEHTQKPLHLEFEKTLNLPLPDLAFRIAKDPFTLELLHKFGKPLISVTFNADHPPSKNKPLPLSRYYMVNLRQSPDAGKQTPVVIRFGLGGRFKIVSR